MINLTIDGKKVEVPEGTTVLEAAQKVGIEIPTLCHHPDLTPYGGCRLCVVEVEGIDTLQTSCTLPVNNDMVVHTDNEKIHNARKFILTMLFNERNHFCPYCQVSGGDCSLQNAAYAEEMTHWPIMPDWKPLSVDASHPFIVLEHNRCILCRLCVRACGEMIGNFTLAFEDRGGRSMLVADQGVPLGESSCISCGACVQVCPTGALIDRWSAYQGLTTDVEKTKTICINCSVGCGIEVLSRDNRLVRIEGDWDAEINHGVLCDAGRFHPMVEERKRVLTPMIRKNGKLRAATWENAYSEIVVNLKPLLKNKDDSIAGVISTRLPAETMHLFKQIFTSNFNSSIVTTTEEDTLTATISKLAEKEGMPFEAKLADLHKADCFIVLSEDITKDHQVISFFIKRLLPCGAKLITINSSSDGLDNFTHAAIKVNLKNINYIVNQLRKPIAANKEKLSAILSDLDKTKDIEKGVFEEAVKLIKAATNPFIVYGGNPTNNEDFITAIWKLAKTANANLLSTKGGANSFAAAQFHLDVPLDFNGVNTAYIALGDEEPSQILINKLKEVPNLIVQSSYISPLITFANVVLPVHNWLEQSGHYINLEGKMQKANSALTALEGAHCNTKTLKILADKLNIKVSDDWKKDITDRVAISLIE